MTPMDNGDAQDKHILAANMVAAYGEMERSPVLEAAREAFKRPPYYMEVRQNERITSRGTV